MIVEVNMAHNNNINAVRPTNNQVTAARNQVVENKDSWTGVNGRIWRHTIGRVSNLARIPINIWGMLFQGGKALVKTVLLPVTYAGLSLYSLGTKINARINKKENYFSVSNYKGSMSAKGISLDLIGLTRLGKNAGICFLNVIVAPKRKSADFLTGVKGIGLVTILDGTHILADTLARQGRDASLSTVWDYTMNPEKNITIHK